jgi:hypothetical protein
MVREKPGEGSLLERAFTPVVTVVRKARQPAGRLVTAVRKPAILSPTGPVSVRREVLCLVLIPSATVGLVCLLAWSSGVAYHPGCHSTANFLASLFYQPTIGSTCQSVPFLSDVPAIMLSFCCPFALVTYKLLRRRLAALQGALVRTGLLREQGSQDTISAGILRLERSIDLTPPRRLALSAVSAAMVTWLYWRNLKAGHLFNTLETPGPNGTTNAAQLRDSWWANYHHHFFLAVVCILIGSVGVYYAWRAGWLYVRLGAVLYATRKSSADGLPVSYVPRWRDRSYGWSPVTGVLMLIYLSTVSLAIAMVAIFDILRNETWTLVIAVIFALIGVLSNTVMILTSFFRMVGMHESVEKRLRATLVARDSGLTSEEYVIAASELTVWRSIPVASFSGSIIKILPGLYALFQFSRAFLK